MYRQDVQISLDELVAYIRKSRTDDPTLTLEEVLQKQEFELREYAERVFGGWLPEDRIFREVASSETIDERPEICKILKMIESPSIRGVYVREVERLSRGDLMDAGLIIRIFRYTGTLIVTPNEIYDVRKEADRMIVENKLKYGNQYLEYSVKNMKRGKDLASMNGEFIARLSPFGYNKISYKEGKQDVKSLEINEAEAEIVRLIFDSYANKGMSMGQIADKMNDMRIKKKTDSPWTRGTIAEIIMNPVYIGMIRWNYRMVEKGWKDQKMVKSTPRKALEECVLVNGKHQPIISEELFYKANERKAKNVPIKKSSELKNPLAGMFFCAKCGKAMKLRQGDPRNVPRFECTDMKYCGNASATYEEVMNEIYQVLDDYIEDFEVKIDEDNSDEVAMHNQMITSLEKRLRDTENKEVSLWDKYTEEGMPKSVFDKLIEKVKTDKEELKEALKKAYDTMPSHEDYEEKIVTFKMALEKLKDESIPAGIKNTLLREIIEKITFEREKSVILTKKLAEEMGVPYPYPLCHHNYPFDMEITLRV